MDVVVIPCFNRPEFLSVCLELIHKAVGAEENLYLFQVDFGYDPEVLSVIEKFPMQKEIQKTPVHRFKNKQSYSLLKGYENALKHNPQKIYLIEDDVFIANDFFLWHRKNLGENFASIATKNHNTDRRPSTDLAATYTMSEYQSLGVCFHAESLRVILKDITDDYYSNPQGYIQKMFPENKIPVLYSEQDGLIRRIIQKNNYQVIYPDVPRAFHAGYYGKSRGKKPMGNLEQRIKQVRQIAFDPLIMKGDSEPVLLVNPIYHV